MRTADSGFSVGTTRTLNVRLKRRKTIPNFSPNSLFGISTLVYADSGIRPLSADGKSNLYDIKFCNNTLIRVMNDLGNDSYKNKISYFYKNETIGWTSWQRTDRAILADTSPFIVEYGSDVYIGFIDTGGYISFYQLQNGSLSTTKITSNYSGFTAGSVMRSVVVNGVTYIVDLLRYKSSFGNTVYIKVYKVNSLTNLSTIVYEQRFVNRFDKATSVDVEVLGGKIYLFTSSNSGDKGIYFVIDPAGSVSEAMPILPIEFKRTGDDWAYFRPHKATTMTSDNGTQNIFIVGELYKHNLYVRQGENYYKGNSILMFAYGNSMFTSSREGFIEARTKEYLYNSAKLIKYGNYVYLVEIGRPILRTEMVPIFGTTPYTNIDGSIAFAIQSTENDISTLKMVVTEQASSNIDITDEIVPEIGYNNKYTQIGRFDVYSVTESCDMPDQASYVKQYTIEAISSGLGRAFTFVSDNFYEFWGTETVFIDQSNYLGRSIVYNGPLKQTNFGLMFDFEKFSGTQFSAIPFLKTDITHTRMYDIIANFRFPDSGQFEIEISPSGYTIIDDKGIAQQSGYVLNILGQAGAPGNADLRYDVNRTRIGVVNNLVPHDGQSMSLMIKTSSGALVLYRFDSTTSTWKKLYDFFIPIDFNNFDTNEAYASAMAGFKVKYSIQDKTEIGRTFVQWYNNDMPFLTGIYNNDANRIHEANPCFSFTGIQNSSFWSQLQNATVSGAGNIMPSSNSFVIDNGVGQSVKIHPRLKLPLLNNLDEITISIPTGKFVAAVSGDYYGPAKPFYLHHTIKYRYNGYIDKSLLESVYGASMVSGFDSYRGLYTTIMRFNYGAGSQNSYYAVVEIMGTMPEVRNASNVLIQNADPNNVYLFCVYRSDNLTNFSSNPVSITFYPAIVIGRIDVGQNTVYNYPNVTNQAPLIYENSQRRGFFLKIPNDGSCYIPGIVTSFERVNIALESLVISSTNRPLSLLDCANYLFHLAGVSNVDCEYIYNGNVTGNYYHFDKKIQRSSAKVTFRVQTASSLVNKSVGVFNGLSMSSDQTKHKGYLVTARNSSTNGYVSIYSVEISGSTVTENLLYSVELEKQIVGDVSFFTSDGYTSVIIGGILVHTFAYERIEADTTYDTNVITIYITSGSTFNVKMSAVDDVLDYYAVDMGMDGGTNYKNLVSERRIFCRDSQNGGVYLYRNATPYDNSSNPIDVYEASRNYSSSSLLTNVRAEGNSAIELLDVQGTKYYGKHFSILPTFNIDGIGNLLSEANMTIRELKSKMNSYKVIGAADPRIEVGDKLYVRSISYGTITTKQLRITSVNMYGGINGNTCSLEMEIEGYEE